MYPSRTFPSLMPWKSSANQPQVDKIPRFVPTTCFITQSKLRRAMEYDSCKLVRVVAIVASRNTKAANEDPQLSQQVPRQEDPACRGSAESLNRCQEKR